MKLNKKYLLLAAGLILIIFFVSEAMTPEWGGSWWLLLVAAAVAVVSFIADFRQAFEDKKEPPKQPDDVSGPKEPLTQSGGNSVTGSTAGGDIILVENGDVIKADTLTIMPPITERPGSAPPKPALMIGRDDDVRALKQRLRSVTGSQTVNLQVLTAIKGWPGVGKTTLASALAHDDEIAKLFPDGILWTSLGQTPSILTEMGIWGRALGSDEILKARSLEEASNLLAGLLRNKRYLLIIDDVWKTEDAVPFNVGGIGCATLITTRLDGVARDIAPTADNVYILKVLKDEDALVLLEKLAPSVVAENPKECLILVKELEGLPLAIQVAGRLLDAERSAGLSVVELIEELREGAKLLEATAPADRMDYVTETTPTIGALLQKSLDLIDEKTKECYAYLGVFAPKPATFDIDAMKYVWEMEDPKPVIKTLVDRGLLEYVRELDRYQMHAILVMLAKSLLSDDEGE